MKNKMKIFNDAFVECAEELKKLQNYDEYSCVHSIQVAKVAFLFGQKLDLGDESLGKLVRAALLHDLGKQDVAPEILNKKDRLDEKEFDKMKIHAERSGKYIREAGFSDEIAQIAEQHHEKENGKGYPLGLNSETRHYLSKIVQISDVFDALMSKRSYKEAKEAQETYAIMEEEADFYDPLLLKRFILEMSPLDHEIIKRESKTLAEALKNPSIVRKVNNEIAESKNSAVVEQSTVMDFVKTFNIDTYEELTLKDIVDFRIALANIMASKDLFFEVNPEKVAMPKEDRREKRKAMKQAKKEAEEKGIEFIPEEEPPIRETRFKLGSFEFGFKMAEDVRDNENAFFSSSLNKHCLGTSGGTLTANEPFHSGQTH